MGGRKRLNVGHGAEYTSGFRRRKAPSGATMVCRVHASSGRPPTIPAGWPTQPILHPETTLTVRKLPRNVVLLGGVSLFTDISSEMLYPLVPVFLTTVLGARRWPHWD